MQSRALAAAALRTTDWAGYRVRRACVALAAGLSVLIAPTLATAAGGKQAAYVIDANTGAVISSTHADEPRYPASLTKMMTLYVVFDLIEQGRLTYQTRIKVSDEAASAPPTKLGLKEGAEIALIDAIKALITKSANDMAVAIAEHIAGSEDKFANLMTQRARQIGMAATTFKNAHGLPDDAQVTTARDMVTLGLRLHDDFPKHFALFSTREFKHGGETHRNHNTMLNNYDGTEGIKTGYTRASGYNLVASVKRGSKHVVGAVFGGSSAGQRNQTMRTLLNIALVKSSPVKTRKPSVAMAALKPLREPKLAVRPNTNADTQPVTKLALLEPPKAVAAPVAEVPAETPLTTSIPNSSAIEVAKVRPILVAPRAPRPTATPDAVQAVTPPVLTTVPPAAAPPSWTATVANAEAPVAALRALPPLASASGSPLGSIGNPQPSARAAPPPRAPAFAAASTTAIQPSAIQPAQRGAQPSSLQAQADNLAQSGTAAAPPVRMAEAAYRLNGPQASPAMSSGIQIQIGAYSTEAEAERQLASARERAGSVLAGGQSVAIATQSNGRTVFRARFAGFDAARAASVCTELRRKQIDCLVAKAE